LTRNPNILQAALTDERNIVVASSIPAHLGRTLPPLNDTPTTHWNTLGIDDVSGPLGLLAVQFSDAARLAAYRETLHRGIAIAAISMALIAIFGLAFGYLLTLRLARLARAAERVSQGDYSVRTALGGRDEIAQVSTAFDNMTRAITAERDALAAANRDLDRRVATRSRELEEVNREHKAFAYAVSHDLRAPLRTLTGFSRALGEDYAEQLDDTARDYLRRIEKGARTMSDLIESLLKLSRISQTEINEELLDLSALCHELVDELRNDQPQREVSVEIQPGLRGDGDHQLLRDALANLLDNAWKFTAGVPQPRIRVGGASHNGTTIYFVQDNGAGFNPIYADQLFVPFRRLHHTDEYPGAGIGLSTVSRIIQRHGGTVWADGAENRGATFYFTLHHPGPGPLPTAAGIMTPVEIPAN
jgi:signal transduction histidine kinase